MAYSRRPPPRVHQSNEWWCWAACLEILNTAHPEKFTPIRYSQSQWVDWLRNQTAGPQLLNQHGGINTSMLPQVLRALRMGGQVYNGPPGDRPDLAFIEDKLHTSYLMGVRVVRGGSHFVIIYGVDDHNVLYYDPYGRRGNRTMSHETIQSDRLIVAWKN
jgi:ABC-type bacteriocin/lantibiotic exporter with double-glycine peptidase domain